MAKKSDFEMKPGVVYIKQSGEGCEEGWDILWLDDGMVRRVRRKGQRQAEEWAARKQMELDAGVQGEPELPFADTVSGADGVAGNTWLELLWAAAVQVGNNPKNISLQKAARTVAMLAGAARKFVDQTDIGEDDISDEEFLAQSAEHARAIFEKNGQAEAGKALLKLVAKGGGK
jgi:hypothetical protein